MKNLETSILINSSAQTVWNILLDFEKYPDWNPFIQTVKGQPIVGTKLVTSILLPGQKAQQFEPEVKVCKTAKEFRWLGKLFVKGLFDGEHYFLLEPVGKQQVKFIHGENFSGLLVSPIMALIGTSTKQGFELMNQALKQQAEARLPVQ